MKRSALTVATFGIKGGTGKTTTTVSLACELARRNQKTLVIDCDPMPSASIYLGIDLDDLKPSLWDFLQGNETAVRSLGENLDILTGDPDLISIDMNAVPRRGLEDIVRQVSLDYEFILFDCPAAFNALSISALSICSYYCLAVEPHVLSLFSVRVMQDVIEKLRLKSSYPIGVNLGLMLTKVDRRMIAVRDAVETLRSAFPNLVFETEIPLSVKALESAASGQDVIDFAPDSPVALAYSKLTSEFLHRINK